MFNILNLGEKAVPVDALTLRYYYTRDEQDVEETCTFAYSFVDSPLIDVSFGNGYVELNFQENSGIITPCIYPAIQACNHEIHMNLFKNNWTVYMQENDYSFDAEKESFKNRNHITLYYNGTLVYGQEPDTFTGISCNVTFPLNCGYEDHWLPNTGQPLALSFINIKGRDPAGNNVVLREPFNNIMILPPIDPGWQTDDPGRSNIHRNKGTCEYDLYVVYSNGNEDVLATFYKDNQADSQYFQVKFTDGYFFGK